MGSGAAGTRVCAPSGAWGPPLPCWHLGHRAASGPRTLCCSRAGFGQWHWVVTVRQAGSGPHTSHPLHWENTSPAGPGGRREMGRATPWAAWPAEPGRPQASARTLTADSSVAQLAGAAMRKHHKRGPRNHAHLFPRPSRGQMPSRVSLGEHQAWVGASLQRRGGPALVASFRGHGHPWLVATPLPPPLHSHIPSGLCVRLQPHSASPLRTLWPHGGLRRAPSPLSTQRTGEGPPPAGPGRCVSAHQTLAPALGPAASPLHSIT